MPPLPPTKEQAAAEKMARENETRRLLLELQEEARKTAKLGPEVIEEARRLREECQKTRAHREKKGCREKH